MPLLDPVPWERCTVPTYSVFSHFHRKANVETSAGWISTFLSCYHLRLSAGWAEQWRQCVSLRLQKRSTSWSSDGWHECNLAIPVSESQNIHPAHDHVSHFTLSCAERPLTRAGWVAHQILGSCKLSKYLALPRAQSRTQRPTQHVMVCPWMLWSHWKCPSLFWRSFILGNICYGSATRGHTMLV